MIRNEIAPSVCLRTNNIRLSDLNRATYWLLFVDRRSRWFARNARRAVAIGNCVIFTLAINTVREYHPKPNQNRRQGGHRTKYTQFMYNNHSWDFDARCDDIRVTIPSRVLQDENEKVDFANFRFSGLFFVIFQHSWGFRGETFVFSTAKSEFEISFRDFHARIWFVYKHNPYSTTNN